MGYGFDDFKDYLKFRMGQRTELESVNGSINLYGVWVNAAYKELTTRNVFWGVRLPFDFPELKADNSPGVSTSDGVAYISTPSDCLHVYEIWDETNKVHLDGIGWKKYISYPERKNTSAENKPAEWARYGSYIYVYPTPDDAYTLWVYYRKRPSALTGTNETAIGEEWDEAILELAAFKGHRWLHEYSYAKQCQEAFMEIVTNLIGIYSREEMASRRTARPSTRMQISYRGA